MDGIPPQTPPTPPPFSHLTGCQWAHSHPNGCGRASEACRLITGGSYILSICRYGYGYGFSARVCDEPAGVSLSCQQQWVAGDLMGRRTRKDSTILLLHPLLDCLIGAYLIHLKLLYFLKTL